jgi:hypothetical protein
MRWPSTYSRAQSAGIDFSDSVANYEPELHQRSKTRTYHEKCRSANRLAFRRWSTPTSEEFSSTAGLGSPAARSTLEHMSVVLQAIEHCGDRSAVVAQFAPVLCVPDAMISPNQISLLKGG